MNSFKKIVVFLFLLLFFKCSFALTIPDKPTSYVNDYAGIMSQATVSTLNEQLHSFDQTTSDQIMVVTFPSLEGESLEDFSMRLAEKWQPGNKKLNNGVILLIFKADHKIRIEVGYGLESVLTDALSDQIIRNALAPAFRAGNYDEGITEAVSDIMGAIKGEYTIKKNATASDPLIGLMVCLILILFFPYVGPVLALSLSYSSYGWWGISGMILILAVLQVIHYYFFFNRQTLRNKKEHSRWWGYWGGGFGGGKGSSSSSGWRFSGGGGRFGGGGASGGW